MASTTPVEGASAVAMGGDGGGGGGGGVAQLRLPSADEIRAQDIFNNCAVRTVVSGVMGTCAPNFSLAGWLAGCCCPSSSGPKEVQASGISISSSSFFFFFFLVLGGGGWGSV